MCVVDLTIARATKMQKTLLIVLALSFSSAATENLQTINDLTNKLCNQRVDQKQSEEAINTIVSLSIYNGYVAGVCGKSSGETNQLNSDCVNAQEKMQSLLKQIKPR